jgi:hypothetical protein
MSLSIDYLQMTMTDYLQIFNRAKTLLSISYITHGT